MLQTVKYCALVGELNTCYLIVNKNAKIDDKQFNTEPLLLRIKLNFVSLNTVHTIKQLWKRKN